MQSEYISKHQKEIYIFLMQSIATILKKKYLITSGSEPCSFPESYTKTYKKHKICSQWPFPYCNSLVHIFLFTSLYKYSLKSTKTSKKLYCFIIYLFS